MAFTLAAPYLAVRKHRLHEQYEDSARSVSGNSWLIFKVIDILIHRTVNHGAVIGTGIATSALIIISVLSALPWVSSMGWDADATTLL